MQMKHESTNLSTSKIQCMYSYIYSYTHNYIATEILRYAAHVASYVLTYIIICQLEMSLMCRHNFEVSILNEKNSIIIIDLYGQEYNH